MAVLKIASTNVLRIRNWRRAIAQLADDAEYASVGRCFVCTHQMATLFCVKLTSCPPSLNCDVKSEIRLRQSKRICLKNNTAKFYANPIWNDGALGFLKSRASTRTRRVVIWWDQFLIQKNSQRPLLNRPTKGFCTRKRKVMHWCYGLHVLYTGYIDWTRDPPPESVLYPMRHSLLHNQTIFG